MSFTVAPGQSATEAPALPEEGKNEAFNLALEAVFSNRTTIADQIADESGATPDPTDDATTDSSTSEPPSGSSPETAPEVEEGGTPDPSSTSDSPAFPPPPAPAQEPEEATFTIGGQQYTQEQVQQALALSDYWSGIPEERVRNIDQYLQGQATIHPAFGVGGPPSAVQPDRPVDQDLNIEDEYTDPRAAADIQALRRELEELRGTVGPLVQHTVQTTAQQQQAAVLDRINRTGETYAQTYNLEPDDIEALNQVVQSANIFPGLVAQHQGNIEAALTQAYDFAFWQVDSLRQRAIEAAQAQRIVQDKDDRQRRRIASSLSSGGSSAPRRAPTPATRADRETAMVAELAAHLAGGQAPE